MEEKYILKKDRRKLNIVAHVYYMKTPGINNSREIIGKEKLLRKCISKTDKYYILFNESSYIAICCIVQPFINRPT